MAKNQPQTPLVTSVSASLKKTVTQNNTQVVSEEEIKSRKRDILTVIDQSLELFKKSLAEGKVFMDTSLDLERIVKLMLLVSGEADHIAGKPHGEQEQSTVVTAQSPEIAMSKIEQILDENDPDVKAMFDKLYQGYNNINDGVE